MSNPPANLTHPSQVWDNIKPIAAVQSLLPYRKHGMWVYDDADNELVAEAFVCGMSEIIDDIIVQSGLDPKDVKDGFRLTFSPFEFPNAVRSLEWQYAANSGNVYKCNETDAEGWLCPALLLYFSCPPPFLYARADKLSPDELDEVRWHPSHEDNEQTMFDDHEEQFL